MANAHNKSDYVTRVPATQREYWANLDQALKAKVAIRFVDLIAAQMDASANDVPGEYYTTLGCTRTKTFLSYTSTCQGQRGSGYAKDILNLVREVSRHLSQMYENSQVFVEDEITDEEVDKYIQEIDY